MKKFLALLLALLMVLSMVACGAKEETPEEPAKEEPPAQEQTPAETPADETQEVEQADKTNEEAITVTYFCTIGAYLDLLTSEIDKWNQGEGAEKGVYIEMTSNINDGSNAIELQMQAGNFWDIQQGSSAEWYLSGWLKDLREIENPEIQELIASYEEYMFPGFCIQGDGAITNLPLEVTPIKMAVNRRLFQENNLEYPTTWDEVVECARIITENSNGEAWGYGGTTWSAFYRRLIFKECAASTEKFYWDPATETYSFGQYEIPINAVKTMYENGWILGLDDLAIDPIRAEFAAGKVGMFPAPSYDWAVYTNQFPCVDEFDFIDPPLYEEGVAPSYNISNYVANISICKPSYDNADDAKKKAIEEAFLFINSDELNSIIYANAGMIPCKQSIIENTELVITENVEQWEQMSDLTNYTLVCPRPDGILPLEGDNFATVLNAYVHGDYDDWDAVVADLEERYNAAYQAAKEDPDIDTTPYSIPTWSHNK